MLYQLSYIGSPHAKRAEKTETPARCARLENRKSKFEPRIERFSIFEFRFSSFELERETGIEPATNSLEGCDSTIELLPQVIFD